VLPLALDLPYPPSMRRSGWALVLVLCAPRTGFALGPLPSVVVDRHAEASTCPQAGEVAKSLDLLVGRHAVSTVEQPGSPARIEIEFVRTSIGHDARIRALRPGRRPSVRDLHDSSPDSCSGLAEAVTLTLALILDTMEGPPPAQPKEAPKRAENAPVRRDRVSTGSLSAGAAFTSGLLDSARGAMLGSFELASRAGHSGGLGFLYAPAQTIEFPPGTVSISLWALSLRGCACVLGNAKSARLSVCAVPSAGSLHAEGAGYTTSRATSRPWLALGAELSATGPIADPLGWSLRTGLLFPVQEESFRVDGVGVAYTPSKQAVYLAAGLSWAIW
jgi:hypothetical protein